jgi:glutamine amidotransferase
MIALIDYNAGNLTSVRKALAAIGADVFVPQRPEELASVRGVIIPGVGHFGATRALHGEWMEAIIGVLGDGRPLLGICLGLQFLFEGSDEAPDCPGLGLLSGRCFRLPPRDGVKIPHVGWNALAIQRPSTIIESVADGSQVYFTHSYVAPVTSDTVAVCDHGEAFAAAVEHGQVSGVQFHPEKSGEVGLQILRNFAALAG